MSDGSKQNDEDENGPENGALKSGPCLIAGFHALSCTSPSYYNPYRGVNKNTLSVDMVRLSLTFKGDRGEWLSRKGAQLTDCDEMSAWTSKIRPGGWYELWSFALGGSSVALGIGFIEPSCKVNMHKGFIEFNPNKVAGDKRFHGLLKTLGTCSIGTRSPRSSPGTPTRFRRAVRSRSTRMGRASAFASGRRQSASRCSGTRQMPRIGLKRTWPQNSSAAMFRSLKTALRRSFVPNQLNEQ